MPTPVTTYYLEMNRPEALKYKQNLDPEFRIMECKVKQYQFNKFLYEFIGEAWQWVNKRQWSDEKWRQYAESDYLRTWGAYQFGSPAGYYELQFQDKRNVEIAYFGLAPRFIGKGYGGVLLSHAIRSAWDWGASRVWVHTCTLDHPNALNNYLARGLKIYKEEVLH
ncbi:MAG: GNAT family N-acetyltransferase [Candidatus Poribacteria bacterium]|nr:GNAT family N-acetyltransferase [Candidatus Poribacteria bacterium]